ncbi:MAG: hypothetical protein KDA24_19930, partial [Deltaproteobacteria bacterium]|nr:hypothetical protein [Deltaproteobacteria bacterium]
LAGLAAGAGAIVWAVAPDVLSGPRWELAYGVMRGWLLLQGAVWCWMMLRLGPLLAREHGVRGREAAFVALAPGWALLAVMLLDGALP